jgi:two-component system sensor histidine kinase ChiS
MKESTGLLKMTCLCITLATMFLAGCADVRAGTPPVRDGFVDLSSYDVSSGPCELSGDWFLFPGEILSPEEVNRRLAMNMTASASAKPPSRVKVPGLWRTQHFRGSPGQRFGAGTCALTIRLPEGARPLVIRFTLSQGSTRVYLDGREADGSLVMDPARPDLVPAGNPQYITIPSGSKEVRIVLQKANWWDSYGSGILAAPTIGTATEMGMIRDFNIGYESFLVGLLLIIAFYHIILFLLQRKDAALILFSLLSLAVLARQLSIGEKYWMSLVGIRHFTLLRMEHGSAYLVCILFIEYFAVLFPRFAFRPVRRILAGAGAFGLFLTFLPDPRIFSGFLWYLHVYIAMSAIFCLYIAIRAIVAKEPQSWAMFAGVCALAIPSAADVMVTYMLAIARYVMPLGFVPFILIESYVLAQRYTRGTREAESLRVKAERLEDLDRVKTAFLANVSHELRTPLSLIKAPVEAVQSGMYGESIPRDHRVFSIVRSNTDRLLRLVENLLAMSRMDAGVPFNPVPTDLATIVPRYLDEIGPLAERSGIELARDIGVRPLVVDIDIRAFEIIFFNLVSNAMKFTPPGGRVTVRLTRNPEPRRGQETTSSILLSVIDTGCGIAAEDIPHLFTRYGKLYDRERRHYDGNGIGLSLSRDIARRLGGDITVESETGNGSAFTLMLPENVHGSRPGTEPHQTDYADLVMDYASAQLAAKAEPRKDETRKQKAARVLVVEDQPDMRAFVAECLSPEYDVVQASDGLDAREILSSGMIPDLVLCDVMMPRLDGIALFEYAQANATLAAVPFIMLTALDDEKEKLRLLREGAIDYIVKPFSMEELRAKVSAVIRLRAGDRNRMIRSIEAALRESVAPGTASREDPGDFSAGLTIREREVLRMLEDGATDKSIAEALGISVRTASNHVASILRKSGVPGRQSFIKKYDHAVSR